MTLATPPVKPSTLNTGPQKKHPLVSKWDQRWFAFDLVYLNASVGAGQLGELDTASVIHIPQTHLSADMSRATHSSVSSQEAPFRSSVCDCKRACSPAL